MDWTITRKIYVNGVLTDADVQPRMSDPTGTFGIKRTDTSEVIVPNDELMTGNDGEYSFTLEDIILGVPYEAWVESVVNGNTYRKRYLKTFAVLTVEENSLSSIADADAYFNNKLHVSEWTNLSDDDKQRCLNQATLLINQYRYKGTLTVSTQTNSWPRTGIYIDNVLLDPDIIPDDILKAQYEIAFEYARGFDSELEAQGLRVTSRGFAQARTTYDTGLIPEHLSLGIPSAMGWAYLLPYFSVQEGLRLHRVS